MEDQEISPETRGEIKRVEKRKRKVRYSLGDQTLMESFYLLLFLGEDNGIMSFVFHVGLSSKGLR